MLKNPEYNNHYNYVFAFAMVFILNITFNYLSQTLKPKTLWKTMQKHLRTLSFRGKQAKFDQVRWIISYKSNSRECAYGKRDTENKQIICIK